MNKKQKFFDSTIKLYKAYRSKMMKETPEGYDSALSHEFYYRLWQLSFIYEKLQDYDQDINKPPATRGERYKSTIIDEGIIFAETFYFFAWRIILIATGNKRKKIKPLPGLQGLKNKAKGIVLVRNNLIVHPEDKKIFDISYNWLKVKGPRLKIARPGGQSFEISDRGLWINAQEFKDGLEELLQNAIK